MSPEGPSPTHRLTLLALARYGTPEGDRIFPRTSTLADATGLHEKTVQRLLREAEGDGWIHRAPQERGDGGTYRTLRYELRIPPQLEDVF